MHPIVRSDQAILIVGNPTALFKAASRLICGSSRPSAYVSCGSKSNL